MIRKKVHDGRLAMITTSSALGRSSIYNRLRLGNRLLFRRVGFTKGSGEFHFSNGLYRTLVEFAEKNCEPTAKHSEWGTGFRNRREVVKKCLPILGLSSECLYHGIEREVFVIPLARNSQEFLQGKHDRLRWYQQTDQDIFQYFKKRWLVPRSIRDRRFASWSNSDWIIWNDSNDNGNACGDSE